MLDWVEGEVRDGVPGFFIIGVNRCMNSHLYFLVQNFQPKSPKSPGEAEQREECRQIGVVI